MVGGGGDDWLEEGGSCEDEDGGEVWKVVCIIFLVTFLFDCLLNIFSSC